jgi:tetratricopeptide (TPR) repeat protein
LPSADLRLEVGPLAAGTTERLVRMLLGDGPPDQVARIARESRGIPYFVQELTRHAHTLPDPSDHAGCAPLDAFDLDEVLWSRIQSLPQEGRRLLEVVSVAGRPLALRSASEAARFVVLEEHLVKILRSEHLVRSSGPGLDDEVEPFHDRIRESVVAHLTPPVLQSHHLRLAESFESHRNADPETIAVHYGAADRPHKAGEYYALAADEASEALAFERAVALYRKSMELRPVAGRARVELERRLADSLHHANRAHEAAKTYESASRQADGETLVELKRLTAQLYCASGHLDEGINVFVDLMRRLGLPYRAKPLHALLSILWLRGVLRLRGLRYREREAGEIVPQELQKIDVLTSASVGISMVQSFIGGELQARSTLLALRAGEPQRIAKAFAWEAGYSTVQGTKGAAHSQALLDAATTLERRLDDPSVTGILTMARTMVAYHQMRLPDAVRHGLEAEEILRDRCRGVAWELATTRIFVLWSLAFSGRFRELRALGSQYEKLAREQDDLLLETNLGSYVIPLIRIGTGDLVAAQQGLDEAMRRWKESTRTYQGFHVQHLTQFQAQSYLHFCSGDGQAAWAFVSGIWPALKRSLILSWESQGVLLRHLRASCALEAACSARDPRPFLRVARAESRRIKRLRVPWSEPFLHHLLAALAIAEDRRDEAIRHLELAERGMAEHDFALMSVAIRHRRGALVGGDEGGTLMRSAEQDLRETGFANIHHLVAMYAPGFRLDLHQNHENQQQAAGLH